MARNPSRTSPDSKYTSKRGALIAIHLRGFTIVELLIVIVVIAILATITVVSYNGISKQARVSKAMTEVRQLAVVIEQNKVDSGTYPLDKPSIVQNIKEAGLWDPGRDPAASYVYCGGNDSFYLVPHPSVSTESGGNAVDGTAVTRYSSTSGGWGEFLYDTTAHPTSNSFFDDACMTLLGNDLVFRVWINDSSLAD